MKTILFDTNFNGKLACDRFAHIDLAPEKEVSRQVLDNTVLKIQVADNSHQPITVKVQWIIPLTIGELSNLHTWPSHGMDTGEFLNWQHARQKGGLRQETMLAVYYYKKV